MFPRCPHFRRVDGWGTNGERTDPPWRQDGSPRSYLGTPHRSKARRRSAGAKEGTKLDRRKVKGDYPAAARRRCVRGPTGAAVRRFFQVSLFERNLCDGLGEILSLDVRHCQ
jgi:hypothetical protein